MGGTTSKSSIKAFTSVSLTATQTVLQRCVVNTGQAQTVTIRAIGRGSRATGRNIRLTQTASVNLTCAGSAEMRSTLKSELINALTNTATSSGIAGLSILGKTDAEVRTSITNRISNAVSINVSQETITNLQQQQTLLVEGVDGGVARVVGIDMSQTVKAVSKSVLDSMGYTTVISKIVDDVDSAALAEEENAFDQIVGDVTDVIESVGNNLILMIGAVVAVIAVVAVVFVVFLFKSGVASQLVDVGAPIAASAVGVRTGR